MVRFILPCLLSAVLAVAGCRRAVPVNAPVVELPTIETELMVVQRQVWPTMIRCQGSLLSDFETTVAARVQGKVASVRVDLGDTVAQDQALIELDPIEFRLQLESAQALLAQSRAAIGLRADQNPQDVKPEDSPAVREAAAVLEAATLQVERARQLRAGNAISEAELQQAESAAQVAQARLASALNSAKEKLAQISVAASDVALNQQRLDDATIKSPVGGTVQSRLVSPGDFVTAGQPLLRIVRSSVLRFRGTIPQRYSHELAIGQKIEIHVDSQQLQREARITRISPSLDEATRSLAFEADLDNTDQRLRAGLFAEANIEIDPQATQIVIPRSAVVKFAGIEKVWTVVSGQARDIPVQLGPANEQQVVVTEGLEVGDLIFVHGNDGRIGMVSPKSQTAGSQAAATTEGGSPVQMTQ